MANQPRAPDSQDVKFRLASPSPQKKRKQTPSPEESNPYTSLSSVIKVNKPTPLRLQSIDAKITKSKLVTGTIPTPLSSRFNFNTIDLSNLDSNDSYTNMVNTNLTPYMSGNLLTPLPTNYGLAATRSHQDIQAYRKAHPESCNIRAPISWSACLSPAFKSPDLYKLEYKNSEVQRFQEQEMKDEAKWNMGVEDDDEDDDPGYWLDDSDEYEDESDDEFDEEDEGYETDLRDQNGGA
ncbi:hypothetical protein UCRPC4_g03686 [Phaeomoniella chlamydospora]|uniref:Transcription factor Iwr1 domain-containing protein n=1 Tax=Phaeomoniella chlamydospora TaxID=158046 RepID=A0A0G2GCR3_PHACM|nr:hypothetical protein UCRPC4_g03686 [Phaeomoniella chlamydospora]